MYFTYSFKMLDFVCIICSLKTKLSDNLFPVRLIGYLGARHVDMCFVIVCEVTL